MIISRNSFEHYRYTFSEGERCYEIQISNAGYISLREPADNLPRLTDAYSEIQFGDSITCIGPKCCANTTLSAVTFGKKLHEIGNYAFCQTDLTRVYIPDSVSALGYCCFASCYNLSSVRLSPSCRYIPYSSFDHCNLASIRIPDGTLSIENTAFFSNPLTSIIINSDILSIDRYAFSYSQITDLSLPNSVKKLCTGAFSCSDKLSSLSIPDTVDMDGNPFFGCSMLSNYSKVQINSNEKPAILKKCTLGIINSQNELIIPLKNSPASDNKPTAIGQSCYENNSQPFAFGADSCIDEITAIGMLAFKDSALTSLSLPNSVLSIANQAFANCQLSNVNIPSNLQNIDSFAFCDNNTLEFINIPVAVNRIGERCFMNCPALKYIVLSGKYSSSPVPVIEDDVIISSDIAQFYVMDEQYHFFEISPSWHAYLDKIVQIETVYELSDATITAIPDQEYTSKEICPAITARIGQHTINNNLLRITYDNNINISTNESKASITIEPLENITKYHGQKTFLFNIIRANLGNGEIYFHTHL